MIKPSKKLKQLVDLFPTRKLFADKIGIDEAVVSKVMSEGRDMPESMILSCQSYLNWSLDDLVEIEEKEKR